LAARVDTFVPALWLNDDSSRIFCEAFAVSVQPTLVHPLLWIGANRTPHAGNRFYTQ